MRGGEEGGREEGGGEGGGRERGGREEGGRGEEGGGRREGERRERGGRGLVVLQREGSFLVYLSLCWCPHSPASLPNVVLEADLANSSRRECLFCVQ